MTILQFITSACTVFSFCGYLYKFYQARNLPVVKRIFSNPWFWVLLFVLILTLIAFFLPSICPYICPNCSLKKDTVLIHDTIAKKDTIRLPVYVSPPAKKSLGQSPQKIDRGGSGIQNNAPNYGNQAGRDINNYNNIKQRELTVPKLNDIISQIPSKDSRIFVLAVSNNKESVIYANQIVASLKLNGYLNIETSGWGDPSCFDDVHCEMNKDGRLWIYVCPASNVGNQ